MVDFEIGSRGKKSLRALLKRLSRFKIKKFYSDLWPVYRNVIDKSLVVVCKAGTCMVESVNSNIGHYLSRFRRKTRCYSKSLEMVKLSLYFLFEGHLLSI